MKPFMVEIKTYGVVMAEDESHARSVAKFYEHDIFNDDVNHDVEVECEVVSVSELEHGWDGECLPYGGDGSTKLFDLLVSSKGL